MPLQAALIFLCLVCSVASQMDLTLQSGATGTAVVLRCVDLIEDSGIFPTDHQMLRRIAYVETRDGALLGSSGGGIWKVGEGNFANINGEVYNVTSLYDAIHMKFAINWTNVVFANLTIPLYSALAARLLFAYGETQGVVISSSVSQQYDVWSLYYYDTSAPITLGNFTNLVAQLPTTCPQNQRDVILAVDSSSTISDSDFALVKSFMRDVVTHFDVGDTANRFGILQYSGIQETALELSAGNNATVVDETINNLTKQASDSVLTGIAVTHAVLMFSPDRIPNKGVGRLLVIITHEVSADDLTLPLVLAAAAKTDIIAIGYSSASNKTELERLATVNATTHALQVANASLLIGITTTVQESICLEQATVENNANIQGSLNMGQTQSFETVLATPTTFTFFTTSGTANCYFSTTVEAPNAAIHDFVITASAPNVQSTFTINVTGNQTVFFAVEGTSQTPAQFVLQVGSSGNPTTTAPTNTTAAPTNASTTISTDMPGPGPLSDGEIIGIVFACLILVCGVIIALAYYWFTRRENLVGVDKKTQKTELDEVLVKGGDSRIDEETLVRKNLRIALTKEDVAGVAMNLDKFNAMQLEDKDGDVVRGERLLSMHQCKDGLSYSTERRNIRYLERSIFEVKKRNFTEELAVELKEAEVLLHDLKKVDSLMERLKAAMDSGDMDAVEKICLELKDMKGCDQATIDRMLGVYRCKGARVALDSADAKQDVTENIVGEMNDLELAVLNRDYDLVTKTLNVVKERGYEFDLPVEVKKGKKLKAELEMVEEARTNVLNLRQSEVSEIRSYAKPPDGVHEVMTAVYLVLGYKPHELEFWTDIQALMGKTGRESIRRQIMDVDTRNVTREQAALAKSAIEPYDIDTVQNISNGLSMFYVFIRFMIEEVEKFDVGHLYSPTPFRTTRPNVRYVWNQKDAGKMIRR